MKAFLLLITIMFVGFFANAEIPDRQERHDVGYTISVPDANPDITVPGELLNLLDARFLENQPPDAGYIYQPPAYTMYQAGLFSVKSNDEGGEKNFDLTNIVNIALLLLSVIAGGLLTIVKKKGREVAKALSTVLDAIEDNKITPEEEKKIAAAIRAIFQKNIGK